MPKASWTQQIPSPIISTILVLIVAAAPVERLFIKSWIKAGAVDAVKESRSVKTQAAQIHAKGGEPITHDEHLPSLLSAATCPPEMICLHQ